MGGTVQFFGGWKVARDANVAIARELIEMSMRRPVPGQPASLGDSQ